LSIPKYNNLTSNSAFKDLSAYDTSKVSLPNIINEKRINRYDIAITKDLRFNYAAKQVNEDVLAKLQAVADEQKVIEQYRLLINGEIINTGEGRKVLHHLCRGQLGDDVIEDGGNLRTFYTKQQKRIRKFSESVQNGSITGSTGKTFSTVVQIGIGGSDLGPRALYHSLKRYVKENSGNLRMNAHFISNVDPDDANEILADIDFERTLFVLVSKSGTTQETLTNEAFVREHMKKAGIPEEKQKNHFVAVTSQTSPLADSSEYLDSFYIDDYIGGRYSSSSAVGNTVLTLAFGADIFDEFLSGAHEADKNALEADIQKNPAMLDALIGMFERNILEYPSTAVLPYSQSLYRFPAHLQQLDMESNGKQVNRYGEPIDYSTGPIIFGEPGTNGQHSFYQLLHQGTDVIPLQFIGFQEPQYKFDLNYSGSSSQKKLNANLTAQIVAFLGGKKDDNKNKNFPGNRPSSLIYGKELTPKALGALLAHFENKVMFQGFIWNINSFDQEGVQLGKVLTKQLLGESDIDPILNAYGKILGVL